MQSQAIRNLKWLWTAIVKNGAAATVLSPAGGGVIYGMIVQNLTATAYVFVLFDPTLAADVAQTSNQVVVLPLPASGNIVIGPEEFAFCEFKKNIAWVLCTAADPTTFTPAIANQATVQLATP